MTIVDGRVLVTPVESDQLHCLDLLTGKPIWEPQQRGELLFTGCVVAGKAIMVGADRVQAISLQDGSVVWRKGFPSGLPSGRGIHAGGAYFLPTTTGHLLKFDLSSGEIDADIETDLPLGNLVAYKDQIISQNVDWLSAYYQSEPLRAVVDRRLQECPTTCGAWHAAPSCCCTTANMGQRSRPCATPIGRLPGTTPFAPRWSER